jgi:hypothetical protein
LGEAQSGIELAADEIRLVRGHDSKFGAFDIAYRRVPSGLKDSAGRPFSLVEGVVLRDRDPSVAFCSKHFDEARARVQPVYERFRKARTWSEAQAIHDEVFNLQTLPSEPALKVQEAISTRLPPAGGARATIGDAARGADLGKEARGVHAGLLKQAWNRPGVRLAVIGGVIATVAVGAYLIAEHRRRAQRQQRATAAPGNDR